MSLFDRCTAAGGLGRLMARCGKVDTGSMEGFRVGSVLLNEWGRQLLGL